MVRDLNSQWLDRMAANKGTLREKMALFWHGRFAVRAQGRNARVMQQYGNIIRQHALGTFGDLLMAVSKTPANAPAKKGCIAKGKLRYVAAGATDGAVQ